MSPSLVQIIYIIIYQRYIFEFKTLIGKQWYIVICPVRPSIHQLHWPLRISPASSRFLRIFNEVYARKI